MSCLRCVRSQHGLGRAAASCFLVGVFMSFSSVPGTAMRFNPPPNWPAPPPGWTPPPGWRSDPAWGPPPVGWQLWVPDPAPVGAWLSAAPSVGPTVATGTAWFRRVPRWAIIAAVVVVGIVIADVLPGIFGHVLVLLVWVGAAWSCLRPARSRVKSTVRIWARIGVAVFACAALYAGSLAAITATNGTSSGAGTSSASGTSAGNSAKQMAGCWGTDGYGNVEFMVSADTLQECEQFVSQLAAVPHDGILPGGAPALGGVQCLMIATSATREPFSVTVGSDAPYNLCSSLAQDGYAQGPTP